jgi:hypothetical protein
MLYYMVTLKLKPGKAQDYMEAFQSQGGPRLFEKHGVTLVGSWLTAVGDTSEIVAIHGYRDYDHLLSFWQSDDPEGQALMARTPEFLEGLSSRIITPTPYSPIK